MVPGAALSAGAATQLLFTEHAFCKEFGSGDDVRSPAPFGSPLTQGQGGGL